MEENKKSTVLAGIVLYNSDYSRLIKSIVSLNKQVDNIILFDNSSVLMSEERRRRLYEKFRCEYIFSGKNIGMPEALNRIMEIANKQGYEWVITMDADSIVPDNIIEEYHNYFHNMHIGMICPQVIDKRRKYMRENGNRSNIYVNMCITSAACIRVSAWKQVGKFDGWLFVDLLDNDISKRMVLNGWKILQINSIILDHEFGEIKPKNTIIEKFWISVGRLLHNDNIVKLSYKKIVNPCRVYYTCRNIIYLNNKFKNYGGIGYKENYNCHTFMGFIICFVLPSIVRANKKKEVLKAVFYGFRDGKNKKVKPFISKKINFEK